LRESSQSGPRRADRRLRGRAATSFLPALALYKGVMESIVQPTLDFISANSGWAFPVMFITAFGESFAFISLLFPGTSILIVAGTLMSAGSLPYWPVVAGAIIGAVLGDSVSFWLGHRYGGGIGRIWPFNRNPDLLPGGIRFFHKHGGKSVFIGRFFGPVRAVIPLAAGIMRMRRGRFWFANVTSALVWAPMLLLVGDAVGDVGDRLIGSANTVVLVLGGVTALGIIGIVWAMVRSARSRS
jgi:membrane protein DedA with SNARE-associated domain